MTSVIAEFNCPFTRHVHTWAWMEAVLKSFILVGCVAPGSMRFIVWISTIILFQVRIWIAVNIGVDVPLQRGAKIKSQKFHSNGILFFSLLSSIQTTSLNETSQYDYRVLNGAVLMLTSCRGNDNQPLHYYPLVVSGVVWDELCCLISTEYVILGYFVAKFFKYLR